MSAPQLSRYHYGESIQAFLGRASEDILGRLVHAHTFSIEAETRDSWTTEVEILKRELIGVEGNVFFEFAIPRMGKRADVVLLINGAVIILEFKVNERGFPESAIQQVWDYALDLKNFHKTSHYLHIIPVLVSTAADSVALESPQYARDRVARPVAMSGSQISAFIKLISRHQPSVAPLSDWITGTYQPTPSIVEAARALYGGHHVTEISRSEGGSENISKTSAAIDAIIECASTHSEKALVLVTGVPGAGKTLVGLDIATKHSDPRSDRYSVFLSGNGPLVQVLTHALAMDLQTRELKPGRKMTLDRAKSQVKAFIQNVHEFRDDNLRSSAPPVEHVALFDEAQRAWTLEQTRNFMQRKKGISGFSASEPEYLISCLDRHPDWAVVVALIGGGQEINTGEAGVAEWLSALKRSFPDWRIFLSDRLTDSEYGSSETIAGFLSQSNVTICPELHLGVSMRSFRAEHVSHFVKAALDGEVEEARIHLRSVLTKYPVVLTRCVEKAKAWVREQARGSERYGMMVSSNAERLRPYAIHVKAPVNPVNWFLKPAEDVRSSFFMEDVVTEFQVQGLELDWACVVWDADFRRESHRWANWAFRGDRWQRVNKAKNQSYQLNAYRVLLTRARQGMVICVPEGDQNDATRPPSYYDGTYEYLKSLSIPLLS